MEWIDWAMTKPQSEKEIVKKIENDGYTYPHYDRKIRCVKYQIDVLSIKRDCFDIGIEFSAVYPLQTRLF